MQIINYILEMLHEFSPVSVVIRLVAALILGGIIGSERGRHGRAAGLRTHIVICIGAALTSLTSMYLDKVLGYSGDVARLSAQVISGIGFLGAGTILVRNNNMITGLTTAAGMWATAAIGIAVGYGFYTGAIVATAICLFCVTVLSRLGRRSRPNTNIYIELVTLSDTEKAVAILHKAEKKLVTYDIIPAKSGHSDNVGIICVVANNTDVELLKAEICASCNVAMTLFDVNI